MKTIIDRFSIYLLAILFATSGYFIGSSRQKVIIALAGDNSTTSGTVPGKINTLPSAADTTANQPAASAAPKKAVSSGSTPAVKAVSKPSPAAPVVAAKPAPDPAPVIVTPPPQTKVS